MTDSVLLVHDDPDRLRTLGSRFEQRGSEVIRELAGDTAVTTLDRARPDVVLVAGHLGVPELVERLAGREAPVLLFGEELDDAQAARALGAGATAVVNSADDDLILTLATRHAAHGRRRRLSEALARSGSPRFGVDSLGPSSAMRQLGNQLSLLAQSERTALLLTGETGVGKAWAARTARAVRLKTSSFVF